MPLQQPSRSVQTATQIVIVCLLAVFTESVVPATVHAAPVEIQVIDRNGAAVRDAVVLVADGRPAPVVSDTAANRRMIMDQLNMAFLPQVLVVPVGASVNFPNSDTVSHQVYSFSPAKPFQLPLYKGATHAPVVFDKPGLVVLGCNIHDMMVGYIYVTDAHWYGQTDAQGKFTVNNVAPGTIKVTVWSPLIADAPATLNKTIEVADSGRLEVAFRLAKPLRSSPQPKPGRGDWDY